MRILVISSLFPNRLFPNRGVFVLNRLKAVQEHVELTVINPIPWFPFQSRLKRFKDYHLVPYRETIAGIDVYHPRYFRLPGVLPLLACLGYCLAVLPTALRIRKTWAYDLLDLHWTHPDLPAGRLLSRLLGIPQLVTVRGEAALLLKQRSLPRKLVARLLSKSDHVITLSDKLKDLCVSLGVPENRISTIRNGVDMSSFRHLGKQTCRNQLGIPASERIILGIGYLTPNKGFDRIITALPEVLKKHPHARLRLIGPNGAFAQGDVTDQLKRLVEQLGLGGKVHFQGEISNRDLPLWYNAADLFCLSSRSEGSPNVLTEALACGCPAVATDVGSVPEILSEDFMGIVVSNRGEGVRSGLLSALRESYDRQKIALHMRQYDWPWCARQVFTHYQRFADPSERTDRAVEDESTAQHAPLA